MAIGSTFRSLLRPHNASLWLDLMPPASTTLPEQSDRVSVGFFSDQTHAVRRAEQVRELGFKPVLDLHQKTVSVHWLDLDLKTSEPDLQPKQFQGVTGLQVADCPAKAAGG
jgi:hypothetical protein